jgi:hypothetical protein
MRATALALATLALLVACGACGGGLPRAAQQHRERRVDLSYGDEPIGDVEAEFEVFEAPDLVRMTVKGPRAVVRLDRTASEVLSKPSRPRRPRNPSEPQLELCLDGEVLPVALRKAPESPATIQVDGKVFVVDWGKVCLRDGDVTQLFVLVSAHWDASNGTRVYVDAPLGEASSTFRWRSEPAKPQAEILALILE